MLSRGCERNSVSIWEHGYSTRLLIWVHIAQHHNRQMAETERSPQEP